MPQAPFLSHIMKTVKICVDPAFRRLEFPLKYNFPHPRDGFTSRIGCVIDDDHDSDLSLTTCFPPVLCL